MSAGDIIVYTADFQNHPRLNAIITGRQILTDRPHPLEYVYFVEERSHRRIRLQTSPFDHNRGPLNQYGRWVIPVNKHLEPYLHKRICQLQSSAEGSIINYLTSRNDLERTTFSVAAEQAKQARTCILHLDPLSLNGQNVLTQTPQLLNASQPMKSAYNANDTVWLRLANDVQVYVGTNESALPEAEFDRVLRRGTYELLIHASVGVLQHHQGKWQSLILRVSQIRYTPEAAKPNSDLKRMLPSFEPPEGDEGVVLLDESNTQTDELDALMRRQQEIRHQQEIQRQQEIQLLPLDFSSLNENFNFPASQLQPPSYSQLLDESTMMDSFNAPPPLLSVLSSPNSNPTSHSTNSDAVVEDWFDNYTPPVAAPNSTPVTTKKRKMPGAPKKPRRSEIYFPSCQTTPQ